MKYFLKLVTETIDFRSLLLVLKVHHYTYLNHHCTRYLKIKCLFRFCKLKFRNLTSSYWNSTYQAQFSSFLKNLGIVKFVGFFLGVGCLDLLVQAYNLLIHLQGFRNLFGKNSSHWDVFRSLSKELKLGFNFFYSQYCINLKLKKAVFSHLNIIKDFWSTIRFHFCNLIHYLSCFISNLIVIFLKLKFMKQVPNCHYWNHFLGLKYYC